MLATFLHHTNTAMVISSRLWSSVVVRSMSVVASDASVVVRRVPVVVTGRQSFLSIFVISYFLIMINVKFNHGLTRIYTVKKAKFRIFNS